MLPNFIRSKNRRPHIEVGLAYLSKDWGLKSLGSQNLRQEKDFLRHCLYKHPNFDNKVWRATVIQK